MGGMFVSFYLLKKKCNDTDTWIRKKEGKLDSSGLSSNFVEHKYSLQT
jgi:hypothetical protein